MKILEVKSIPYGSTSYVSDMIAYHLSTHLDVTIDTEDNLRSLSKNPLRYYSFYKKTKNYDLLHTHLGKASQMVGRIGSCTALKIGTLHGFQNYKHYRQLDFFTAVSNAVKTHYINQGAKELNIQVIPNGVEQKFLDIQNIPSKKSKYTIIQVGHLDKNITASIKIIDILRHEGYNVELIVAGDGNMAPLNAIIKDLKLEKYIHLIGFVRNIESIYQQADLLISTSKMEGFCLPILEAMATGIPIVSHKNLGSKDFCIEAKNGFYAYDDNSFVALIKNIINNLDLRKVIYENNKRVASQYTWDKISKQYFDYFVFCLEKFKHIKTS